MRRVLVARRPPRAHAPTSHSPVALWGLRLREARVLPPSYCFLLAGIVRLVNVKRRPARLRARPPVADSAMAYRSEHDEAVTIAGRHQYQARCSPSAN